jgi:hypothetical protein
MTLALDDRAAIACVTSAPNIAHVFAQIFCALFVHAVHAQATPLSDAVRAANAGITDI